MSMEKAVYVQLMENILEKIRTGEYRVGEKIMSERQMAQQYGINRLTVRSAIKKLVEEGTLVSIQGKGTFVGRLPKNEKKVTFGDNENVSLSRNLVQKMCIRDRSFILNDKQRHFLKTADHRDQIARNRFRAGIEGFNHTVVILAGVGDFPFHVFQLPLQINEVSVGLQIRIALRDRHQTA